EPDDQPDDGRDSQADHGGPQRPGDPAEELGLTEQIEQRADDRSRRRDVAVDGGEQLPEQQKDGDDADEQQAVLAGGLRPGTAAERLRSDPGFVEGRHYRLQAGWARSRMKLNTNARAMIVMTYAYMSAVLKRL